MPPISCHVSYGCGALCFSGIFRSQRTGGYHTANGHPRQRDRDGYHQWAYKPISRHPVRPTTVRRLIAQAEIWGFAHLMFLRLRNRIGDLRFRLPQPLLPYHTSFSAMKYGPSCPQQPLVPFWPSNLPGETVNYLNMFLLNTVTASEDCA